MTAQVARALCNLERHFSVEAKARRLSSLSKFVFEFSGIPDTCGLHGGLPHPSIFPLKAVKVSLDDGGVVDLSDPEKVICGLMYRFLCYGWLVRVFGVYAHTRLVTSCAVWITDLCGCVDGCCTAVQREWQRV
jgi:hypothetical protein